MQHRLAARVRRAIRAGTMFGRGDRIVVAVSGGPDSVALVHLLLEVCPREATEVVGLVHLNHALRGDEASGDEAFCREMAARLGLAIHVETVDVGALARDRKVSVERAGHDARYACFERARTRFGASHVATGHNLNDEAETVLLRLVRGAGRRGLGGIHPVAGRIVRPLLDVTRREIVAYLRDRSLDWREDASNDDRRVPRNLVRHEVLPLLERFGSRRVLHAIGRAARLARDEEELLDGLAAQAAGPLVKPEGERVRIDRAGLAVLAPALSRRVVRRALDGMGHPGGIGVELIDGVLRLVARRGPGTLCLPGCRVEVGAREVVLSRVAAGQGGKPARNVQDSTSSAGGALPLPVPGRVETASGTVIARRETRWEPPGVAPDRLTVVVDEGSTGGRLFVRTRRPGDRFRPLGLGGRKKLQDFFVDRKVPRAERDGVPLIVDAGDRIVWVAGHAIAEEFRVTPETTGVLLLELKRPGG